MGEDLYLLTRIANESGWYTHGFINRVDLSSVIQYLLGGFVILLLIVLCLVLAGIIPRVVEPRKVDLAGPETDWEGSVTLNPESIFTVDQPISVEAVLTGVDPSIVDNPTIILENTTGDSQLHLIRDTECDEPRWTASGSVSFTNPGENNIRYHFGFEDSYVSSGQISTTVTHLQYRMNKYVLVFSILTAIIACASLILTLQQ